MLQGIVEWRHALIYLEGYRVVTQSIERLATGAELEEDAAERPDVAPQADFLLVLLRWQIPMRPGKRRSCLLLILGGELSGVLEVEDLDFLEVRSHQDALWLQGLVHDILLVQVADSGD